MVEISDEEFMIIKDFIDVIELPEEAPEELMKKYTDALQVINAFGQSVSTEEMGAPTGGAIESEGGMPMENMKKMRDMAAMMMQMMDEAMGPMMNEQKMMEMI